MREGQADSVQPLAFQSDSLGKVRIGAVVQIAHTGMAERAHVDTNLVGTAGFQPDVEEARVSMGLDRAVMRDTLPAVGAHGELEVVLVVAGDGGVDGAGMRIGVPL